MNNVQPACNVSECDSKKHELNTAPGTYTGYLCDYHQDESEQAFRSMARYAAVEAGLTEDEAEREVEDYLLYS